MNKILITGGTGMIGKQLANLLISEGYEVNILSRSKREGLPFKVFTWDLEKFTVDKNAFEGVDCIIHLAGAGIADKRWTKKRKQEIIDSRVKGLELLYKNLPNNHTVDTVISASGIGFYGAVTSSVIFSEEYPPGNDYIADVCQKWEAALLPFKEAGIRTVSLRTAVVLSTKGGALVKLCKVVRNHAGSVLGSGKQYMPWVHIHDVCCAYLHAIKCRKMRGPYNLSMNDNTQESFVKDLAAVLGKRLFLPAVPSFLLKLVLGDMAVVLLEGSRVSSDKLEKTGFKFEYRDCKGALVNLLKRSRNKSSKQFA